MLQKMFQEVATQRFFSKLSLKYESLLLIRCNKIILIWSCCMLLTTKFTVKNVAKQSYLVMGDKIFCKKHIFVAIAQENCLVSSKF